MPEVSVTIAERRFTVTCGEGEEQHLLRLGNLLDETARNAGFNSQGFTESRLLLFTSLLLADRLDELQKSANQSGGGAAGSHDNQSEMAVRTLQKLAPRLEKLATALEEMAQTS